LKGLAVLERLVHAEQPIGVSALALEFHLPKSNMHRTLNTLVQAGYVAKNQIGNYVATLKTWELGVPVINRHGIRRAAWAVMPALFQEAQETVNLIVLDGDDCLYIHQLSTNTPIRPSNTIGERVPAIMTVSGKAMLAQLPDWQKRVRDLYAKQKDPKPPMKLSVLLNEIETIRERGYAHAPSVWRTSINSLAGVIVSANNTPVAAIAIAGPKERFTEEKLTQLIPSLLNACTMVSRSLGG